MGAVLGKEATASTSELVSGSSDLWEGVELRQTAQGIELSIRLRDPVLYTVDHGSHALSMTFGSAEACAPASTGDPGHSISASLSVNSTTILMPAL